MSLLAESSWSLFVPIAAGYGAAFLGWLLLIRSWPRLWPAHPSVTTDRKWLDLALVFVAAAAVLGLGELWRRGWLLPARSGRAGDALWTANNLIIYAPLFLIVAARRQSLDTMYLSPRAWPVKVALGIGLGIVAVGAYAFATWDLASVSRTLAQSVLRENLRYFVPVFLEGVALAFLFVRLRWVSGRWPAVVAPAVLFAAAHVPRQLQSGLGPADMAGLAAVTIAVVVAVLLVLERSRDVIWIGFAHYLMDVATKAFE